MANIDYVGTKDGEAFSGGTAEGFDLALGSGTFIDGFEDGVVGMNVGEEKDRTSHSRKIIRVQIWRDRKWYSM